MLQLTQAPLDFAGQAFVSCHVGGGVVPVAQGDLSDAELKILHAVSRDVCRNGSWRPCTDSRQAEMFQRAYTARMAGSDTPTIRAMLQGDIPGP